MNALLKYFTNGTHGTRTGGGIGAEIETDFVGPDGAPILSTVSRAMLTALNGHGQPDGCVYQLELGRQKIEMAVGPFATPTAMLAAINAGLAWLYRVAGEWGAVPRFEPVLNWPGSLLEVGSDVRDQLWLELDGAPALELMCQISSVQFTVDVNPADAIRIVNQLWAAGIQASDYPNDTAWRRYIHSSRAGYLADRYGGPPQFASLADYATQLARHRVMMHNWCLTRSNPLRQPGLDIDLFLRSVWWHYRLRRYNNNLAVEVRPFARRDDLQIAADWSSIAPIFGL